MSGDQNKVEENIENLKANKSLESTDLSPDMQQKEDHVNKEPQENRATRKEGFPDLKRKGLSIEEATWGLENGLRWIRKELNEMRAQDRVLAKQLIGMRSKVLEISRLGESDEHLTPEDDNSQG